MLTIHSAVQYNTKIILTINYYFCSSQIFFVYGIGLQRFSTPDSKSQSQSPKHVEIHNTILTIVNFFYENGIAVMMAEQRSLTILQSSHRLRVEWNIGIITRKTLWLIVRPQILCRHNIQLFDRELFNTNYSRLVEICWVGTYFNLFC